MHLIFKKKRNWVIDILSYEMNSGYGFHFIVNKNHIHNAKFL